MVRQAHHDVEYVSTNVRLPKELLKNLKLRAVEEDKSMGEILREALLPRFGSPHEKMAKTAPSQISRSNPFYPIIALGKGGVSDSSSNHDKYLYGKSKREWKR